MTKYTDEQIAQAIEAAVAQNTAPPVRALGFGAYKKVIDALPEPQDEWEACAFEDIRKGDRVREVVKDDGTIQTTEGVASYLDSRGSKTAWKTRDSLELALDDYALDSHKVTLYRIPAPVQHPDPEQYPVIYVKECDLVNFIPKIMVWYRDSYVAGRQCLSPERITDWQHIDPAKVVATDEPVRPEDVGF